MQNEIYHCGPIACGIDAMLLLNLESGIISTAGSDTAHVISIVVGSRPTGPKRNPLSCPMSPPGATVVAACQASIHCVQCIRERLNLRTSYTSLE